MASGVEFKKVSKRYGRTSVIEGMDLSIVPGEFMVLVGPSGCGKSTALRMIAGLEAISDGTVLIAQRPVNDLPPKDRDVAMVFQNYALYPHMTVKENLEFGLKLRHVPEKERDHLVTDAASILGLDGLLARKPKQLSGGQRQRVALGRAIVRKPAVFLFDEPLSNLDAKLRVQMRAEIKKLQHRLGVTTVYVTHDQVEAMTMGTRIAVMKGGKLQQVGSPIEVYDCPVNLFVAQFIGTPPMNFLTGTLQREGRWMKGAGFELPMPPKLQAQSATIPEGTPLIIGIRPEHIHEAPMEGTNLLTASVEFVEPLGDNLVVHSKLGESELVLKVDPHRALTAGDTVTLHVATEHLHIFDSRNELRLVPPEQP